MTARRCAVPAIVAAAITAAACGGVIDRDHDGLDDRLEASLAAAHLPRLHEFARGDERDGCPEPQRRPIVYRAHPVAPDAASAAETIAITYVLLYERDCGALGHDGDAEAFTVFVRRDAPDRWTTVSARATAHQGTPAQFVSTGSGADIWISRNKHGNFASFDRCGDSDIPGDVCAKDGHVVTLYALLNVGEPSAHLSNDLGEVSQLFRGRPIWDDVPFLGAGSLVGLLVADEKGRGR